MGRLEIMIDRDFSSMDRATRLIQRSNKLPKAPSSAAADHPTTKAS